jgi:hypothetical protein
MYRTSLTVSFAWFIMLATSTASLGVLGETAEEIADRYQDFEKRNLIAPVTGLHKKLGDQTQWFASPDLWVFVTFKNGRSVLEEYNFIAGGFEEVLIGPRTMDRVQEILFANAPRDSWVQVIGPEAEGGIKSEELAYAWQSNKGPTAMVGTELNGLFVMAEIEPK